MLDRNAVEAALGAVEDPELLRTLADLGMIRSVDIDGRTVSVMVGIPTPTYPYEAELSERLRSAVWDIDSGWS